MSPSAVMVPWSLTVGKIVNKTVHQIRVDSLAELTGREAASKWWGRGKFSRSSGRSRWLDHTSDAEACC